MMELSERIRMASGWDDIADFVDAWADGVAQLEEELERLQDSHRHGTYLEANYVERKIAELVAPFMRSQIELEAEKNKVARWIEEVHVIGMCGNALGPWWRLRRWANSALIEDVEQDD